MENTVTLRINDSFVFVQWLIRNAFTCKQSNYIYMYIYLYEAKQLAFTITNLSLLIRMSIVWQS